MDECEEGWLYNGPAADRLWAKSAIGIPQKNGGLILASAEVIFCHHHRHIELPSEEWIREELRNNPLLIDEANVLEALRVPGNKIVLNNDLNIEQYNGAQETWGYRWNSSQHPRNSQPVAEIRWFRANDKLNLGDLVNWIKHTEEQGRIAEILVIDSEQAVVTYNLRMENPRGELGSIREMEFPEIKGQELADGCFILEKGIEWNVEQIGIPYPEGIILDKYETELLQNNSPLSEGGVILADLLSRGLHPRPGFKYGTKWRCYDKTIGTDHAPWLVVLPSDAPKTWADACLASRLAAGVNKVWLHPIIEEKIEYVAVVRPPADSRWSNPIRR